eukprot:797444-Rhodomonas_salina.5
MQFAPQQHCAGRFVKVPQNLRELAPWKHKWDRKSKFVAAKAPHPRGSADGVILSRPRRVFCTGRRVVLQNVV